MCAVDILVLGNCPDAGERGSEAPARQQRWLRHQATQPACRLLRNTVFMHSDIFTPLQANVAAVKEGKRYAKRRRVEVDVLTVAGDCTPTSVGALRPTMLVCGNQAEGSVRHPLSMQEDG